MPESESTPVRTAREPAHIALRLFFVDKKNGAPIAALPVSVFQHGASDVAAGGKEQSEAAGGRACLASLQTDAHGYVSFKFHRSSLSPTSRLAVTYANGRTAELALTAAALAAGNDTHTVELDASAEKLTTPHGSLPSVMAPDARDLSVSPASIGLTPRLVPGAGLCQQLMPTTVAVRRFKTVLIRPKHICRPETIHCTEDVQFVRGEALEFEVAWYSAGTALGDLLNSVSLAPCEQVNVAISDWTRRERAAQSQATDVQQSSAETINDDRSITETMTSSVSSHSSSTALAAGTSLQIGASGFNLSAALAAGYSSSDSNQDIAINVSNHLTDKITQTASFLASQRSTAVFEATAAEHQTFQTRTVRNNNHCHTLTVVYYQINRVYRVVTDYKGEREVILIKYDNIDFDAERAFCNAELLKDALLDQSLRKCFDELADALFCCNLKQPDNKTSTSGSGTSNVCLDQSCCVQKLLGHLNCHKRYYNSLIWLAEDPNERIARWSCCTQANGHHFSLLHLIENSPITVYGDFVVFPAAGSQLVDDPAVLPVATIVTMPTPGVFSEAILGSCNSCEVTDPHRFWNWKESPCPDCASSVATLPTAQGGVKPGDLKADAISNLIHVSSLPNAPESIIKDLISEIVASAESGSAASKDLLNKLLEGILGKLK